MSAEAVRKGKGATEAAPYRSAEASRRNYAPAEPYTARQSVKPAL